MKINHNKRKKEIYEKSKEEIKNSDSKILTDEKIEEIVNKNFHAYYQDSIDNYNDCLHKKRINKHDYHVQIRKCFIPLITSVAISLSTIGGLAIYCNHNDCLEAFTKYHKLVDTYTVSKITSESLEWEQKPIDSEFQSYVKTVTPTKEANIIKTSYYTAENEILEKIGEEVKQEINIDNILEKYKEDIKYDNYREEISLKEPSNYVEVNIIEKDKEFITAEEKEPDYSKPYYKTIIPGQAIAISAGLLASLTNYFNKDTKNRKNDYKNSKTTLKKAKQKLKMSK